MSEIRPYIEDNFGTGSKGEQAAAKMFQRMRNSLKTKNLDPFKNIGAIAKSEDYMAILTEAAKLDTNEFATDSVYVKEDITRLNTLQENVGAEILNEATMGTDNISPIIVNSYGIQERALISTHLPRAVKQITANVDNFKLSERIPYIVDLAGNKYKMVDAFLPNSGLANNLKETKTLTVNMGSMDVDLYSVLSVDKERKFGFDSALTGFEIKEPTDGTKFVPAANVTFDQATVTTTPNVENGQFSVKIVYKSALTSTNHNAWINGQFDFSNGKLLNITSNDANVTKAIFTMVLSPETHHAALSVSYDMKHTPVNIPIGEHFEYGLSEEFKDASEKYYNADAMALLTDYMGRAVEQVKDLRTLLKFQELEAKSMFNGKFNCDAPTGFTQGKEEYIKRQFHPYVEQVCILLKDKVRIPNCHFRVVGNPMDIRIAGAAGVEYIYKRNEQFVGDIVLDYEFSVTSDVHKIFYLSSERIPQGKIYVFLIPNTIENNISTVNHYEYATYVSNKYKGTKSNLPTVMISTRYLTKEYYPVIATITMQNNKPEELTA